MDMSKPFSSSMRRRSLFTSSVPASSFLETAADATIDAHGFLGGVLVVHVVAFDVGDHFQCKLIMIAKKNKPLAAFGNFGGQGLPKDFDDGLAILELYGHEHSGHERKMKRGVEFVAVAKIGADIRRPLIGLSKEHGAGIGNAQALAEFANDGVGFGQVFTRGSCALDKNSSWR